ncbi:hypothetical protein ACS0TY_013946 [Phlomoides rotata]
MGSWCEGKWVWGFVWARSLYSREEEKVEELTSVLNSYSLTQYAQDIWYWNGEPDGTFTVKKAYKLLATASENSTGSVDLDAFRMLWKSTAIRRSQSIGWKILKSRLPTRDALKKRGIIPDATDSSCPCCEEAEESISHLFFDFNFARSIWYDIYKWTNCCMVSHVEPGKHLLTHSSILGNNTRTAVAIWNSAVDLIWR